MRLWLRARADGENYTGVSIAASPGRTVGELADALVGLPGLHADALASVVTVEDERTGRVLSPACRLADAGLHFGSAIRVIVGPTVQEGVKREGSVPPVACLQLVSGAGTGARFWLGAGRHVIGRGRDADIVLDDPFVAPRHAVVHLRPGEIAVEPIATPTYVDGGQLATTRTLGDGERIDVGATGLVARCLEVPLPLPETGQVPFNRQPRITAPEAVGSFTLAAPPAVPARPSVQLAPSLAALAVGLVGFLVFRQAYALLFVLLTPVMALAAYVEARRSAGRKYRREADDFRGKVAALAVELGQARAREVERRHAQAPPLQVVAEAAATTSAALWERRPTDPDFLVVRVGVGREPSRLRVTLDGGGDPRLRAEAEEKLHPLRWVEGVPMVLPLAEAGVTGICGERATAASLARWIIIQAATHHSPKNLAVAAAVSGSSGPEWSWLKWLPHAREARSGIDGPLLADSVATGGDLLERVAAAVELRQGELAHTGVYKGTAVGHVILLLDGDLPMPPARLARILENGPSVGVFVLWLGRRARDLPNECRAVVEAGPEGRVVVARDGASQPQEGDIDEDASLAWAEKVAFDLAPLLDRAAAEERIDLPPRVGLLEVLGLPSSPSTRDVGDAWSTHEPTALRAPIGVTREGVLALDLCQDGPHGLIAGTTGSGKSELLQTAIVAFAARTPPQRLNLLLVDYKGGAAFAEAARLPHAVGLVTDLEGQLAVRVLRSLRAEIRRREALFRDRGFQDLEQFTRSDPEAAPPRLLIVVDEFAALAQELPDFVEGVVDLARRGRSLGFHLLLATQRPAGVVTDGIRANTGLRICLRVSGSADSIDVIGAVEAAHIPRALRGRAFIRTGYREIREFQVAHGGAPAGTDDGTFDVRLLDFAGEPAQPGPRTGAGPTELRQLVDAVAATALAMGLRAPRSVWLPQLPSVVSLSALAGPDDSRRGVAMGLLDRPDEQVQVPWVLDVEHQNLIVYGGPRSGKTTALLTLAAAAAQRFGSNELHLYAIDCGDGALGRVEALAHCGSVIPIDDVERVTRLIRWLGHELEARRAGRHNGVRVLVLLDDYGGFSARFEKLDHGEWLDAFSRLVADGRSVGLHFAITADRRAAVPGSLHAATGVRLVLRMDDEGEYRSLRAGPRESWPGTWCPGRGWIGEVEVQVAMPDAGAFDPVATHAALGRGGKGGAQMNPPVKIRALPRDVALSELSHGREAFIAAIGLRDADLGTACADMARGHFLISGPHRSGRSTALATTVASLARATPMLEAVLLTPRPSPLAALEAWTSTAVGQPACCELARRLGERGERRNRDGNCEPLIVVVEDGEDLDDEPVASALEALVSKGVHANVTVIAAVESSYALRAFAGWIPLLKRRRRGLLLQPDDELDGEILRVRLPRRQHRVMPPGRGYLVEDGNAELIQVGR